MAGGAGEAVTLVSFGAFNPPTLMHLRMFEDARCFAERRLGWRVAGGLLCPLSDRHAKAHLAPAHHRLAMCRAAAQTSDWIRLGFAERRLGWRVAGGLLCPLSDRHAKAHLAPAHHRLAMCRAAVQSSDWIRVEASLAESSEWVPWVEVLRKLAQRLRGKVTADAQPSTSSANHPSPPLDATGPGSAATGSRPVLLMGGDVLASFGVRGLWDPGHVRALVRDFGILVIPRHGSDPRKFVHDSDLLTKHQKEIHVVPVFIANDVSATAVRRALRRLESVKYLVPDNVIHHIHQNALYRDPVHDTVGSPREESPAQGIRTYAFSAHDYPPYQEMGKSPTPEKVSVRAPPFRGNLSLGSPTELRAPVRLPDGRTLILTPRAHPATPSTAVPLPETAEGFRPAGHGVASPPNSVRPAHSAREACGSPESTKSTGSSDQETPLPPFPGPAAASVAGFRRSHSASCNIRTGQSEAETGGESEGSARPDTGDTGPRRVSRGRSSLGTTSRGILCSRHASPTGKSVAFSDTEEVVGRGSVSGAPVPRGRLCATHRAATAAPLGRVPHASVAAAHPGHTATLPHPHHHQPNGLNGNGHPAPVRCWEFDPERAASMPDLNGGRLSLAPLAPLPLNPQASNPSLNNLVMRVKQFKISPTPETTV